MFERLIAAKTVVQAIDDDNAVQNQLAYEAMLLERTLAVQDVISALKAVEGLEDTKQSAAALKAAVEQYGLTPSLVAFANHDGSLTQAADVSDAISLENLDESAQETQKQALIATLESFITTDNDPAYAALDQARAALRQVDLEASTEGFKDAALIMLKLFIAGPFYAVPAIMRSGKVKGTLADFKRTASHFETLTALAHKIVAASPTQESANEIGTGIKSTLSSSKLDVVPFGESGWTADSFKGAVNAYAKADKEYDTIFGALDDHVSGKPPEGVEKKHHKAMFSHADQLDADAFHDLMTMRRIIKSAQRFFSKTKPSDSE